MDENRNQNTEQEADVELVVTLMDGNGEPYEATILNSFMVRGNQYVSVLPVVPDDNGEFPIILFAATIRDNGGEDVDVEITTIPDEDYPGVAEYYERNIMPLDMEAMENS